MLDNPIAMNYSALVTNAYLRTEDHGEFFVLLSSLFQLDGKQYILLSSDIFSQSIIGDSLLFLLVYNQIDTELLC